MTLRRSLYNAAQRAARELGQCASVPPIFRHSNQLGWERIGFTYLHRQCGEQHIIPCNDLRPHEETHDCWCGPVEYELGVWGHCALDGRDLAELGERRVQ